MQLILFDDHSWENLLPLTFTRPVSALRVGISTIAEKWERILAIGPSFHTLPHLKGKFPEHKGDDNLFINGSLLPEPALADTITSLSEGESLKKEGILLAVRTGGEETAGDNTDSFDQNRWIEQAGEYRGHAERIDYPWKIFNLSGQEIEADFRRMTEGRESQKLSDTVRVLHPERIFAEPGFKGEHITLNASGGSIYLGRDSEIMEGSMVRGPFALCEEATVKMGAKIYGPTTIGPGCRAGGEINNSVLQANSNKSHDGFLGNAVIGEWCNLGADTNNSNLKNNYSDVKIWNYRERKFINSGRQFCGLFMGDHSKCGINTMFNTGTVVGVSANIFGPGFPRNFIPSFSWGGAAGLTTYRLDKALETAQLVMERRETQLTDEDRKILEFIFSYTEPFRKNEG